MNFYKSWIAYYTLARSEIRRCLRIWVQSLLPSVITMTLYFAIFGHLIGSQISAIGQYSYMQYITPGLVMMAIITNSYSASVFSLYLMRFQHSIDEILVSPLSNSLIILGFLTSAVFRGLVVGSLVVLVSLFFTHLRIQHGLIMFMTAFFASIIFALLGLLNAMFARNFDDANLVPTFILTPLTYFGGVFYSVSMLPVIWQKMSYLNPILYIINAFRYGMLGVSDVSVINSVSVIIFLAVLLFFVNLVLFNKGIGIKS